ncbi:MAG TPA: ferritin family protein [Vicinamibacteria bacterium]|jgi:rubrerythrin
MPIRDVDLSRLSLKDALDLAALVEEEAHERYLELADQMEKHRTPEAARFFRFMAENEAKHGAALAERRHALFGDAPRDVRRTMIFDVEAPDYDEVRAFMSARHALGIALRAEEKAHAFFVEALAHLKDAQVNALFAELRDEEVHHQDLVRREMLRLPPEADTTGEAFVDEPSAQ